MQTHSTVRVGLVLRIFAGCCAWALILPLTPIASLAGPSRFSPGDAMPLYKPREAASPRARIGGQARGAELDIPTLIALVPDHVGFTVRRNPALCWYLSEETSRSVLFTVVDSRGIHPVIEQPLPPPIGSGLHCLNLHDYGVDLREQEPYRWFITLVVDPGRPSRDVVAGGMIERIPYDEACILGMACSNSGCTREAINRYAESGLWYDAVGCLLELLQQNDDSPAFRAVLDNLLAQVGVRLPMSRTSLSK